MGRLHRKFSKSARCLRVILIGYQFDIKSYVLKKYGFIYQNFMSMNFGNTYYLNRLQLRHSVVAYLYKNISTCFYLRKLSFIHQIRLYHHSTSFKYSTCFDSSMCAVHNKAQLHYKFSVCADGLPAKDLIGKSDPYFQLKQGDLVLYTSEVIPNHRDRRWGTGPDLVAFIFISFKNERLKLGEIAKLDT